MCDDFTTISAVADIFDGPHATPNKTDDGPFFLNIASLQNGRLVLADSAHLSDEDFVRWTRRVTPSENDLLFSYETRLGEAALMPAGIRACLGRRMGLLRPKLGKVDPEFLLYSYLGPHFQQEIVANTITGATVDRIPVSEIGKFKIRIPELAEQQKIAAVLSALDAKIDLNQRINAELEALAKTIYDYWFVQFDFPDAHGRPYKSSGGAVVWNDTLKREIPAGWCVLTIGDVILKQPKALKVPTSSVQTNGSTPVIDQSTDFICGYTDEADAKIEIETPHVVFGDHTRIVKLVCFDYARGADGTQVLVPNTELVAPFAFFQSIARVDLSNYGYARHFKFLKSAHIVVPEICLANGYDEVVRPLFTSVEGNRRQNRELTHLRDWLLPLLMNGQVRVA
ncbi:restriction endonuclease subunit S [Rhodanobacter caeni]|uniref:Type I restriction modification DNA specificity domain-containing protein n=1 Tax=Rhodanobacter caeni TaxID=657654 RepID=A0ABP3EBC7_9GAMM